jgi:ribosomal protein S18 acetylase RimI-like enzyme
MLDIRILRPAGTVGMIERNMVRDFLFTHLEQYGDKREDIGKAIEYALNKGITPGGYVVVGYEGNEIVGAVVVNCTGMEGYIPENILVYIATHNERRGKGYGKKLMEAAIAEAQGNIALHVEPDNPAKILYEKLGFTNKYLEMRLDKSSR